MRTSHPGVRACLIALIAATAAYGGTFGVEGTVKVRVRSSTQAARLLGRGGRMVGDYGSFSVVEMPAATVSPDDDVEVLRTENLILLNSSMIDTSQTAARRLQRPREKFAGKSLHLLQFAGPVQAEWFDELAKTGVRIVSYIPSNTYLVYGDTTQIAGVQGLANRPHVQWDAPYTEAHKIHPRALAPNNFKGPPTPATDLYAIQLTADAAANSSTLRMIDRFRSAPVRNSFRVLNYQNIVVKIAPEKLVELARQPDVISIQPYTPRELLDECQDQIVAGNLSGMTPSGPGYLSWLASRGFTQAQFTASGFVVDITDSGLDNGTTSPNHFGLYVNGMPPAGRVVYNRLEGLPNGGSTIKGCDGHGTLNGHIIGGYSNSSGFPFQDGGGFSYGLGVAPFVKVGSSVIFDPSTYTSPNLANLQSEAYQDNARISSNSWGSNTAGSYDIDAQAYDALVRDAQPPGSTYATAGNQEMVIVFANGNAGPGVQTVGTPATAKNVISVGAAENTRAIGGADASGIDDSGADSADDIIAFSSRGPCADGRNKPDIVAPGTHVTGGVAQAVSPGPTGTADACYTRDGVSGGAGGSRFFPSGQEFYTASSGTSHATPAVSGGAALIRQFFLNLGMAAPSPAMTKALLINSARYLTGTGANDTLWSNAQGMGEMNLGQAFNRGTLTPTLFRDQESMDMFTATGQVRIFTGTIADAGKPLRVTLVWTDAPGPTTGAAYLNNLDLTVAAGADTYKGNVFVGDHSVTGGSADFRNNVESVFLPAGLSGNVTVTVTASDINSDGVPNVGGALDQDFALVVHNVSTKLAPVMVAAGWNVAAEACLPGNSVVDPGEMVTVNLALQNIGTAATSNLVATLQATGGVNSPTGPQNYGIIPIGSPAVSRAFTFLATGSCGSSITATLQMQDGATPIGTATFALPLGSTATTFSENFDAVTPPAFPSGWVATIAMGSPAPWMTVNSIRDSLPNSAFAPDPGASTDNRLTSPTIAVGTTVAQLTFRHNYNFEIANGLTVAYDGGVLEIAIGAGAFTDIIAAGGAFVTGGYVASVSSSFSNPLAGRSAWSGNSAGFVTTTVRLPAGAAGHNVQLRWRVGTDSSISATGWYIDSISITEPVCCVTPPPEPCHVPFADFDGDGDVDQGDFAAWQLCMGPYVSGSTCSCLDRNGDSWIDASDLSAFLPCQSGPDVLADPGCEGL